MAADKLHINTAMCMITLIVQNCTIQTECVFTLVICLYNDINNNRYYHNIPGVQLSLTPTFISSHHYL